MNLEKVLIANDNEDEVNLLSMYLKECAFTNTYAAPLVDLISFIQKNKPDIIFLDITAKDYEFNLLIKEIYALEIVRYIIITTEYNNIKYAVRLMNFGVIQYITKPYSEKEIKSAVELLGLYLSREYMKAPLNTDVLNTIIGKSKEIEELKELIKQISAIDTNVLITGESGTGKELVAKAIHSMSNRAKFPFVTVNCASISESLVESEMFGHKKGAFTGAINDRVGYFESSHNGTLFLDEIGETSLSFQSKLLRAVEEKKINRVGSNDNIYVNTHIISATNVDLKSKIHDNQFRKDLFYRLSVITIDLPPLRDRVEDISPLAEFFLKKKSKAMTKKIDRISDKLLENFCSYSWPGNVRELENTIEEAVILADSPVLDDSMLSKFIEKLCLFPRKNNFDSISFSEAKKNFEIEYLSGLLKKTKGNLSRAAKLANMDRKNLREKAKKYNIKRY